MNKDSAYWLHKLATLRVAVTRGDPAPHKPLLILTILEMADQQAIANNIVALTPDLAFRFSTFSSLVAHRRTQKVDIRLPLFHLKGDGILQPLARDGSAAEAVALTRSVRLDPAFAAYLSDAAFRQRAKLEVIASPRYFQPEERIALYAMLGITPPVANKAAESGAQYRTRIQSGRDARFRINVVIVAYNHTCALTGTRMTTTDMESIVDAAHIHEFHASKNNDVRNGLALSKNAHWMFDRGLWSISEANTILVNHEKFIETGARGDKLADLEGRQIHLPGDEQYWPGQEYLDWHRRVKFAGNAGL